MAHFTYPTQFVCASKIDFDLEGNVVTNISFTGGCNGNLKAIARLVNGFTVEQIEEKCKGNTCGLKPTSCADQLARVIRKAYETSQ